MQSLQSDFWIAWMFGYRFLQTFWYFQGSLRNVQGQSKDRYEADDPKVLLLK